MIVGPPFTGKTFLLMKRPRNSLIAIFPLQPDLEDKNDRTGVLPQSEIKMSLLQETKLEIKLKKMVVKYSVMICQIITKNEMNYSSQEKVTEICLSQPFFDLTRRTKTNNEK